jgi:hypothetical protein
MKKNLRKESSMQAQTRVVIALFLAVLFLGIATDGFAEERTAAQAAFATLRTEFPGVQAYTQESGRITRLYGRPFGYGDSPVQAAELFRQSYAAALGAKADDLLPVSLLKDKRHTQPLMYNQNTGQYKFTLVYYSQYRDDIPVFRSELRLLARNEPGNPIVLAVSTLRDLGDFTPLDKGSIDFNLATASAQSFMPNLTEFTEPEAVIWAGIEDYEAEPTLAVLLEGSNDNAECWLFVVDASTGEILYDEDQIIFEDVYGNVSGLATEGTGAEHCEEEVLTPMKYVRASIGSEFVYTNDLGGYVIPNAGTSDVEVVSPIWGQYFRVYHYTGTDAVLYDTVTPPGPANFTHNAGNTEEVRAQVNSYVEANIVRDLVIKHNPFYPAVSTQFEFPVYANRTDGYCPGNAWYSSSDESINFCMAGSGYPNTSWSSVIHHEYGHHLVEMAGSGQGEYGEGMGDVMGILISDESGTGFGFYGDCLTPLREADNDMQYPCSGAIHYCGQLLSGCVWSTRNELMVTYPSTYLDTLANLAINAMLLHTGSYITPQITIDWLTVDDDDGFLDNGTPNRVDICAGFGAHNMDCPELTPIFFSYPEGLPGVLAPGEATTFPVTVNSGGMDPVEASGELYYSIDGGAYQSGSMVETSPNEYDATLPALNCDNKITFYFSAEADGFGTITDPSDAPTTGFSSYVATGLVTTFEDNFELHLGWTVSGDATDGQWDRGIPAGGGDRGDPPSDFDGSGRCYLTDNVDGNSDVDGGTTILTSPTIDLSEGDALIHYARWYSNVAGDSPNADIFVVYVSNDDGTLTWVEVETVGPVEESSGGWYEHTFLVSDFVIPTATVKVRFDASDLGSGSVVEAAIDDFSVKRLECDDQMDSDEDGILDLADNCPFTPNPLQEDDDVDDIGNVCDNCPDNFNPDQDDADGDEVGDSCDTCTDIDGDGFGDPGFPANLCAVDNCPTTYNPSQEDYDGDALGDSCDHCTDIDGDGFGDPGFPYSTCLLDNCPSIANADQSDGDEDGLGDSCDVCTDSDDDGYGDPGYPANTCEEDNCPTVANPDQDDSDDDGVGNLCDNCPDDPEDLCCDPQFDNNPPLVTSPHAVVLAPGESFDYTAEASDDDCDGTDLVITIQDVPSWCSVVDLTVSGTADCQHTDTSFNVIVSDGDLADTATVLVTVDHSNVAPEIGAVDPVMLRNGLSFEFYPGITDPDDTEHAITYTEYPTWCAVQNDSVIGTVPEEYSVQTLTVIVADMCNADTLSFDITTFLCGDADQSGEVDIDDVVYIISYIFSQGPAPVPAESGDVECSGETDIDDVVYIIAYIFSGGAVPCADCP